ncbi:MAG: TonB-dependent receptor [Xanthomonadaceae bacterium]|nr:TonB-dependent receptor [Xanthomonadaceae bacterium]
MAITVSSVSRKDESIANAPGAIFVITQEDIRRSGVTSIPEALRLAPGVQVNRMDANKWAITIRGFNDRFANKLLVLMDGRSLYSPLFAGVCWELQDYPLEDIDHIEIIRGGSGTLWGANAVNGVINIITKNASDTQGFLLTAGTGSEERGFGTLRYGSRSGRNLSYRVYGKAFNRDSFARHDGKQGDDDWRMGRTGFRLDWLPATDETISLHGDYYKGKAGQRVNITDFSFPGYIKSVTEDAKLEGGNLFCRWQKKIDQDTDFDSHFYYDYTSRDEYIAAETRHTIDFDFQHHFSLLNRHKILWGLGYRFIADHLKTGPSVDIGHPWRSDNLFSGFLQDEITFFDHHLRLIVGARLEHNDYTDYEIQPNLRFIYTTDNGAAFWAAWSRGVRTPARIEHSIKISRLAPPDTLFPGSPTTKMVMQGNTDYKSENIYTYELGFRSEVSSNLFVDFALFYNDYQDMASYSPRETAMPGSVVVADLGNEMDGHGYGAELTCTAQLSPIWKLTANYNFMTLNMDAHQSSTYIKDYIEDNLPRHQVSLRSWLNLPGNLEFDSWLRYTGALANNDIDDYFNLDLRLGWQISDNFEISLVGQNLLDNQHIEYGPSPLMDTEITEVERGFYVKIQWKF